MDGNGFVGLTQMSYDSALKKSNPSRFLFIDLKIGTRQCGFFFSKGKILSSHSNQPLCLQHDMKEMLAWRIRSNLIGVPSNHWNGFPHLQLARRAEVRFKSHMSPV